MINFRFHLVSLIAVFLALAIGVVVGSTVIDRAIVDGLEAQIDRVERRSGEQREENGRLRADLEEARAVADQLAPFALDQRLAGVPVAVLATRGTDEEATRAVLDAVRDAGGLAPAVLWLEPAWGVEEVGQRRALRELIGLPRADAETARAVALEQLASRLAGGEFVPADPAAPDLLSALVERGFLQVDPAGGPEVDTARYPGVGARALVVTDDRSEIAPTVFPLLLAALADSPLPTVGVGVGEPDADAAVVAAVRRDDDVAERVSTVDTARGSSGRVAVVLVLEEAGRGGQGHYGAGPGAERRLPEPPEG